MTDDILRADATRLAELIASRQISPVEVVQAHLDRIAAVDGRINAIVTVADDALAKARAAEEATKSGAVLGPLHGVPFTAKDSIDTAGVATQRASPIFKGRVPDTDATSVARLKAAGAILLAKTNLPEFSYSTETDNGLTGRTNNPWNVDRTPGGSSGGESAAIAAGMSPLGLGTDLAISIRGPAANTGVIGFKASHGRVPMTGIWPRAPRRNWHVGPMARSVRDVALAFELLQGPDGADGFATIPRGFDTGLGTTPTRPVRVGWLVGPGFGPIDDEVAATVRAAAEALAGAGCETAQAEIPTLVSDNPLDIFWQLHVMEVKPAFAEVVAGHEDQMFRMSKQMLETPDTSLADFVRLELSAERLRDGFAAFFQHFDALLCPAIPVPAHEHAAETFTIGGETVMAGKHSLTATVAFNVTGLPGLSIRFGTSREGLPIGVQLVSNMYAESTILFLASLLESLSPTSGQHPPL